MQITFSRSGGFAALPGMTIEATLSVDAKGARVESDGGQYQRALSVAEMAHFALLAEPAGAARLAEGLRAGAPAGQADRFHFQLSFGSGARRHSFDFSEGHIEGLRAQAPALAAMLEWIGRRSRADLAGPAGPPLVHSALEISLVVPHLAAYNRAAPYSAGTNH